MTRLAGVLVRTLIVVLVSGIAPSTLHAQPDVVPLWRAGVGIAPSAVLPSASFEALPGVPQPAAASAFSPTGSSFAVVPFGFIEIPAFSSVSVGAMVDYRSADVSLTASEIIPVRIDTNVISAVLAHTIDAQVQSIGIEPFVHLPLFGRLGVRVGPRADIVGSVEFEQAQEIVDPPGLEFIGYEGKVVTGSGEPDGRVSVLWSLSGALTYSLSLGEQQAWQLRPEAAFRLGLTDVVSGIDWTMSSLSAGVALVYAQTSQKQRLVDTVYQRDTTSRLVAGLEQEQVRLVRSEALSEQSETPDAIMTTVTVQEQYVRELPRPMPLLTADLSIAFVLGDGRETSEVSGDIRHVEEIRHVLTDNRFAYATTAGGGELSGLFSCSFSPEQRALLGFDAHTMRTAALRHVDGRIRARGATPHLVVAADDELRRQAETGGALVQRLCADAWQTSVDSVPVRFRAGEHPEGAVLIAVEPAVTEPLLLRDTVIDLPVRRVVLRPTVASEAGLYKWELRITVGTTELYRTQGEGTVPDVLSWVPEAGMLKGLSPSIPIHCVLTVEDNEGQIRETVGSITFRRTKEPSGGAVEWTVLRFIVQGRELDSALLEYIRRHMEAAGARPVSLTYWYPAPSLSVQPMRSYTVEAGVLGIPPHAVTALPQPVPASVSGPALKLNGIIDIRAESTQAPR